MISGNRRTLTAQSVRPGGVRVLNITQGEFAVSDESDLAIQTVLGSCIAVCIRDAQHKIGGMNHFLLPDSGDDDLGAVKYGAVAMELLVNGILRAGGQRQNLEAKMFGGGNVMRGLSDIGKQNIEFATRFLRTEQIPCVGQSVGGEKARRLRYFPTSGLARQQFVEDKASNAFMPPANAPALPSGDLELF